MEVLLDARGEHRERRGVELVEEEQREENREREDVDPVGDTREACRGPTDHGTTSPLDFAAANAADSSTSSSARISTSSASGSAVTSTRLSATRLGTSIPRRLAMPRRMRSRTRYTPSASPPGRKRSRNKTPAPVASTSRFLRCSAVGPKYLRPS